MLKSTCSYMYGCKLCTYHCQAPPPPTGGSRGFGRALEQMNFIKRYSYFHSLNPNKAPTKCPYCPWGLTLIGALQWTPKMLQLAMNSKCLKYVLHGHYSSLVAGISLEKSPERLPPKTALHMSRNPRSCNAMIELRPRILSCHTNQWCKLL